MMFNIYFSSDGTTWWIEEMRTEPQTSSDWAYFAGPICKTPLGQACVGDVDLTSFPGQAHSATIHFSNMRLQAFR